MLGGLYGDLPPPSSSSDPDRDTTTSATAASSAVWSTSTKMAPPTLRKPLPPPSLLKPRPHSSTKPLPSPTIPTSSPPRPALVAATSSVLEEYDPSRPNDYEDYRRLKKRLALEAELQRDLDRRRKQEQQEQEQKQQQEEENRERERRHRLDSTPDPTVSSSSATTNTPTPADLNISGEEAWRRRAAMSGNAPPRSPSPPSGGGGGDIEGFSIGKSKSAGLGVGAGGQMTAAQRMMAKMGWKEGQGLGKQEQGITTPLMAKKTDRRAGVIVNASETAKNSGNNKPKTTNFNGPPTRVLLLRNMVGPGEVDDELEDEVASECAKYGTVTRVLIFEITEPNFPQDEAVRIFVQFDRSECTTKALIDLGGRYFGGKVVKATFYDEERFARNELAPLPGEVPGFD